MEFLQPSQEAHQSRTTLRDPDKKSELIVHCKCQPTIILWCERYGEFLFELEPMKQTET